MTEKCSQLPNNTSDLIDEIFLLTWNSGILVHMGNHAAYYNTAENSWEPFPYSGGVVVSVTNEILISIGYEGDENGLGVYFCDVAFALSPPLSLKGKRGDSSSFDCSPEKGC